MRKLVIGVAALALLAPAAHAQQSAAPVSAAQTEPGRFLVFFGLDQATLTQQGAEVVAQAAEEYDRTGAARIAVTGYTDRSGSESYNLALSQRRAEAVERELVRQGVPAPVIAVVGKGEIDPLVPTADGVRDPRNRRVEIEIPQPVPAPAPAPAPAPVAVAPEAGPPPAPKWTASLGGVYGSNFRETDEGTTAALAGVEGRLEYLLTPNLPLSLEQDLLYAFQSEDDGLAGRSAVGLNLQGNFAGLHPYIGANFGAAYGKGIQDGLVAGPEVGVKFDLSESAFLYGKAAYDYQFRNSGLDDGIAFAGLGAGWRF